MNRFMPKFNPKSIPKSMTPEVFNKYFCNVAVNIDTLFPEKQSLPTWKGGSSIHKFGFVPFEHVNVLKELRDLTDLPGIDILNIDRKLLRMSAELVAPSLCSIFNQSLRSGLVDGIFKTARVTPVFKGGEDADINNPSDYRPISVISHIAKIFEKLVKKQLMPFLERTKVISQDQSAYLGGHSTQTSLHRVVDALLDNFNEGEYTAACVFDISKCFDTINHVNLLHKLDKYGISGDALAWFRSYLSDRTQLTYCHNVLSTSGGLSFGVPQGSILGPLLFLLYINDVQNFGTNGCIINIYADDLLVFTSGKNLHELQKRLQGAVDSICTWYQQNRLKVNPKKSKLIVFGTKRQLRLVNEQNFVISYNGLNIPLVNEVKYLGLILQNDLSWDKQIFEVCKKLNYKIFQLKQLQRLGANQELLLNVYKTFIQCIFDYGISLWGMTTQANILKVQRKQNKLAKIIMNVPWRTPNGISLVKQLGLLSIAERRDYFLSKFTFESVHGLAPDYLSTRIIMRLDIHPYRTRSANSSDVYPPRVKREIFKRSLEYAGAIAFNSLPSRLKNSTSIDDFKRNYRRLFSSQTP